MLYFSKSDLYPQQPPTFLQRIPNGIKQKLGFKVPQTYRYAKQKASPTHDQKNSLESFDGCVQWIDLDLPTEIKKEKNIQNKMSNMLTVFTKKLTFHVYLSLFCVVFFYGCTLQPPAQQSSIIQTRAEIIPSLSNQMNYTLNATQEELEERYLQQYFSIWNTPKDTLDPHIFDWMILSARNKPGLGENLLPNTPEWIESLIENMDINSYPNTFHAGIITQDTSLRLMPTDKPRFFKGAGEGYPFDQWQNSGIYTSTPVLITQSSRDKKWYFVQSSFAAGWVLQSHVAIIPKKDEQRIQKKQKFIVSLNDSTPILKDNQFLQYSKIGKLFWLSKEYPDHYEIKIPMNDSSNQLIWKKAKIDKQNFTTFPLKWNTPNMAHLTTALIDQKYGWGGLLGNRDCSAMTRDFFTTFGLWLPRNSKAQVFLKQQGEYIVLSETNKEQQILEQALPWGSLLWFQGHVMIYVGEYEGKAMVFHSIWGLRTIEKGSEGRYVIGKSLISDLHIGTNITPIDQEKLLIQRVVGMRNLFSSDEIILNQ